MNNSPTNNQEYTIHTYIYIYDDIYFSSNNHTMIFYATLQQQPSYAWWLHIHRRLQVLAYVYLRYQHILMIYKINNLILIILQELKFYWF